VNPPFCEELMEKMNAHLETLLANSDKPLSFIIFLPHWMTPPSVPIEYLKTSKFLRESFIVEANEHKYCSGFQQTGEATRSFTPVHSSIVFFLQNDAGFSKWQPTPEKIAEVRQAFLPSQ
jgi:phosphorylated CTD-interacting factor 1